MFVAGKTHAIVARINQRGRPRRRCARAGPDHGRPGDAVPPFPDSWIAFAAADDGTAIEVYPTTHILTPGPDQINCDVVARDAAPSFAHFALCTVLKRGEILDIAEDKAWTARVCDRGPFACVELWIENRLLVEVLDAQMQSDYRAGMTAAHWASMFGLSNTLSD